MTDSIQDRGRAMENSFFLQRDKELLDALRKNLESSDGRSQLKSASGIDNDAVIDQLIGIGMQAETIAAIGLIPLVMVAWADHQMDESEINAVLKAATESGMSADSDSYKLVQSWLKTRPGDEVLQAWKNYVAALKTELDAVAVGQLKTSVINRARKVADAAGGFLGMATTSSEELAMITDLESAF